MTITTSDSSRLDVDDEFNDDEIPELPPLPAYDIEGHPARRIEIENHLDSKMLEWRFVPAMPIEAIDEDESLTNQVRHDEPVIEDLVSRYAQAMSLGDVLPAVIAHPLSRNKKRLRLLDGNHRYLATKRVGRKTIPVYIVTASKEALALVGYEQNALNGRPPTQSDIEHQVVHLSALGYKFDAIVRVTKLSKGAVNTVIAKTEVDRRARTMKIDGFDQLPVSTRVKLRSVFGDAPFEAIAKLAVDENLTGADVTEIVRRVQGLRNEREQVEAVGSFQEEITPTLVARRADRLQKPGKRNDRNVALAQLTFLRSVTADRLYTACADDEQRRTLGERLEETGRHLIAMAGRLAASA